MLQVFINVYLLFSQLCLTLLRPHGLQCDRFLWPGDFLSKKLEWVAISFSKGFSWPKDQPASPALADSLPLSYQGSPYIVYSHHQNQDIEVVSTSQILWCPLVIISCPPPVPRQLSDLFYYCYYFSFLPFQHVIWMVSDTLSIAPFT